jgi:hypothetical protein
MTKSPWPDDGQPSTIEQAATLLITSPQVVRNALCKHASRFPSPRYAKRGGKIRRILSETDLRILRELFPIRGR